MTPEKSEAEIVRLCDIIVKQTDRLIKLKRIALALAVGNMIAAAYFLWWTYSLWQSYQ